MKKLLLAAAALSALAAAPAHAGGLHVGLNLFAPVAPVYYQPPPPPVYYAPPVAYYRPAPPVYYAPDPYRYGYGYGYRPYYGRRDVQVSYWDGPRGSYGYRR